MATTYETQARRLSSDPGVIMLGQVADVLAARVTELEVKVQECCGEGVHGDRAPAPAVASAAPDAPTTAPAAATATKTNAGAPASSKPKKAKR